MAKVSRSKKELFRQKQLEWIKIGAIWGVVLPGLAYIDFLYRNPIFYTIYVVFCYFALKITSKIRKRLVKLNADYKFLKRLEAIDEDIHALQGVKVEKGKKGARIDWTLVNRQGVWCLEVNILAGKICGKENEKEWSQTLKPKNPKSKTLSFPNPLLEVRYGAKRLKDFLKQRLKEDVPVYQAVVFTNASELEVGTFEAVLLNRLEELFQTKGDNLLTPEKIGRIVDAIKEA